MIYQRRKNVAYKPTYKYNVVRTDPPMITKDGEKFEKVEGIWYNLTS